MRLSSVLFVGTSLLLTACGPKDAGGPRQPIDLPTPAQAFAKGSCEGLKPQVEPDLMGWEPGARANLARLRGQGVVAVRYQAKGCDVELELLPHCIAKGKYTFSPYSSIETVTAHDAKELFTKLPLGAARLSGALSGDRALRTDRRLVGMMGLPPDARVSDTDLSGSDCTRATHVVSAIYLGAFSMVAGERRGVEAMVSAFGAGAGGSSQSSAERIDREGEPSACEKALSDLTEHPLCAVPLRVGLQALERAAAGCGVGTREVKGRGCLPDNRAALSRLMAEMRDVVNVQRGRIDGIELHARRASGKLDARTADALAQEIAAQRAAFARHDEMLASLAREIAERSDDAEVDAVRLRDLEARTDEVKDQMYRSKARLALLAETVMGMP